MEEKGRTVMNEELDSRIRDVGRFREPIDYRYEISIRTRIETVVFSTGKSIASSSTTSSTTSILAISRLPSPSVRGVRCLFLTPLGPILCIYTYL